MQCPICNVSLQMTDRQGIEIDYCPQCRGVWLDRGELDKLIERSTRTDPVAPPSGQFGQPGFSGHAGSSGRRDESYEPRKHKKKKSFWTEIFDFA